MKRKTDPSGSRDGRYAFDGGASESGSGPLTGDVGLDANVVAALAYVFWFVSGVVVYVLEDDREIRFHAAQSITVFGGLSVLNVFFGMFAIVGIGSIGTALSSLLSLLGIGLWVFLIATAYRGETRRIPVAADIADRLVGSGSSRHDSRGTTDDDALAALRGRYARGEIGEAEFERRLERLLETEDDTEDRQYESPETGRSW
ncbi:SHOCT domain-containing protein [Halococcus sp. IIIV-5B]|uniref:SHOCT domain-containing protein n=1 Tax=Halococcus sp. IIIV-5B TaxID=2321230 RepID=UPI001F3ACFC3|nr:SHOCT domain-containing protein [Halococcus sp. IIIV-5B]